MKQKLTQLDIHGHCRVVSWNDPLNAWLQCHKPGSDGGFCWLHKKKMAEGKEFRLITDMLTVDVRDDAVPAR